MGRGRRNAKWGLFCGFWIDFGYPNLALHCARNPRQRSNGKSKVPLISQAPIPAMQTLCLAAETGWYFPGRTLSQGVLYETTIGYLVLLA